MAFYLMSLPACSVVKVCGQYRYRHRFGRNVAEVRNADDLSRPAHGSVITEPSKLLAMMDAALRGEIDD
jgi:hypothetical protein